MSSEESTPELRTIEKLLEIIVPHKLAELLVWQERKIIRGEKAEKRLITVTDQINKERSGK